MTQIQSRDVILREEEYCRLLREASQDFGQWVVALAEDSTLMAMPGTIAKVAETGLTLETFLDDHGARQNQTFVAFGEMVASCRGLALVKGTGMHLLYRLRRYDTLLGEDSLEHELREGLEALDRGLRALCCGLIEEAAERGIRWTAATVYPSDQLHPRRLLPRNLDAEAALDDRQHLAQIAAKFRSILVASRNLGLSSKRPLGELREFVAEHATEERCRWYESTVHSVQSMYDTYVLRTALEEEHPWLLKLRGHVSVSLHLLEMATGLVHFYERHENDIRHAPAAHAVSSLVAKDEILQLAVNVCLRQAYLFVEACAEIADRILDTFTTRRTVKLTMPEGVTLHARPLALIVQVARHHGTPVEISMEGESCSANSLMDLIMLGAAHPHPREIEAQGDRRVLADLEALFQAGLGETDTPMPVGLDYLKTST